MHGSDFTATLSLVRGPKMGRGHSVHAVFTDGTNDLINGPSDGGKTYDSIAQLVKGTKRATGPAVFGSGPILTKAMDENRVRAFART